MYIYTAPRTVNKDYDQNHNFNTTNKDTDTFNGLSNEEEPLISVRSCYHIIAYTWKSLNGMLILQISFTIKHRSINPNYSSK